MNTLANSGYRADRKVWSGYTNGLLKWETIGECKAIAHGRMSFQMALEEVRQPQNQPYRPNRPSGEAAKFHLRVAQALETNPERLGIYTAVGSSLAEYHGVDGFFVFEGIVVTFDVVIYPTRNVRHGQVFVQGRDIIEGYPRCSMRIADLFRRASSRGMKGVV